MVQRAGILYKFDIRFLTCFQCIKKLVTMYIARMEHVASIQTGLHLVIRAMISHLHTSLR